MPSTDIAFCDEYMQGHPNIHCCAHRDSSATISDVTPGVDSGLNVRTLVHEYGGGDFLVGEDTVYFSNFK
jgi:hypothetical protein